MRRLALIVVAVLGCAAPAEAQLSTGHLRDRADTLALGVAAGGAFTPVLRSILRTRIVGDVVERVERTVSREGEEVSVDSFTARLATLAPLSQSSRNEEGTRTLRFEPGRVTGSRTVKGRSIPIDAPLDSATYYGNAMDLILGALPLAAGYATRISTYDPDNGGARESAITVEAVEEIAALDGGQCRAWRVMVDGEDHGGTYWIDADDRSLVRYDAPSGGIRLVRATGCARRAPTRSARR